MTRAPGLSANNASWPPLAYNTLESEPPTGIEPVIAHLGSGFAPDELGGCDHEIAQLRQVFVASCCAVHVLPPDAETGTVVGAVGADTVAGVNTSSYDTVRLERPSLYVTHPGRSVAGSTPLWGST